MSEVVEAVARAICDWQEQGKYDALADKSSYDSIGLHQEHWQIMARAALTVALDMMREPSGDMIDCAVWKLDGRGEEAAIKDAVTAWKAMHDQLRKEIPDD